MTLIFEIPETHELLIPQRMLRFLVHQMS